MGLVNADADDVAQRNMARAKHGEALFVVRFVDTIVKNLVDGEMKENDVKRRLFSERFSREIII